MGVVPFVVKGENATVVETRQEYEKRGGLAGNAIMIQPMDRTQLESDDDTNISYDVRIGRVYRDHRDRGIQHLGEGDEFKLLPGNAVIVETLESLRFPRSAFGQIVPKVSLLQKGISNTSSKIDPGYDGNLLITLFNLGKRTETLHQGDRICSFYVLRIDGHATVYDKPRKTLDGDVRRRPWRKVRDFMETNAVWVSAVTALITLILIVVTILVNI